MLSYTYRIKREYLMDIVYGLATFFAGLGLLLFSIKLVGESLEKTSGARLRKSFSTMTNNKFKAAGLGLGVTLLLQSSTAAIVMTVALCDAGVIAFLQTIPLVMGINVGSSITLILVSFGSIKVVQILCILVFVGAVIFIFAKSPFLKNIGKLVIGLGALFLGITLMSSGMAVLNDHNIFAFITQVTNPALLILVFMLFTCVLQTSMGAAAILVTFLGTAGISGIMSLQSALWAMIGINIGTSLSSYLATIGASKNAKRAGFMHILFNTLGAVIWSIILLFVPVSKGLSAITSMPGMHIFMFDVMFNLGTLIVLFPFSKLWYKLVMKIFPDKKKHGSNKVSVNVKGLLDTPTIALGSLINKTTDIYKRSAELSLQSIDYVLFHDEKIKSLIQRDCMSIDESLNELENGILQVSTDASASDQDKIKKTLDIIQRNKDISKSIKKLIVCGIGAPKSALTIQEKKDIGLLQDKLRLMIIASLTAFDVMDLDLVMEREPLIVRVLELGAQINNIKVTMKESAVGKVKENKKTIANFTTLTTILNEIEWLGEKFTAVSILAS